MYGDLKSHRDSRITLDVRVIDSKTAHIFAIDDDDETEHIGIIRKEGGKFYLYYPTKEAVKE